MRSYNEIAKIMGVSKGQAWRDCQAIQKKIDKDDEKVIYDLTAILERLNETPKKRLVMPERNANETHDHA